MNIEVKAPEFDLNFYKYHIRIAVRGSNKPEDKESKLRLLIQRAYEQGVAEGKRNAEYYEKDF